MELSTEEAFLRIFLALILGAVVGVEREFSQQSAGLRTHILVCLGATVYTIVSISDMTTGLIMPAGADLHMVRDPARIAAQIVSGIGFIGGGAVLRHGANVRGLTTAANLWMMASIGMLVGTGQYRLAVAATLLTFLVLFTIGNLERTFFRKNLKKYDRLRLQVTALPPYLGNIQSWIAQHFGSEILELKSSTTVETNETTLTYDMNVKGLKVDVSDLNRQLSTRQGVLSSSIRIYQENAS